MLLSGKKYYDDEVLDVLARLYSREKSPERLLQIIAELTGQKEKANQALDIITEGYSISDGLFGAGLISQELYLFLKSSEKSRNLKDFVSTYREIKKRTRNIFRKFMALMFSPVVSFIGSLVMTYVFIYRVIPQLNLPHDKALRYLPFYFKFVFFMSDHLPFYLIFVSLIISLVIVALLTKEKFPVLRKYFGAYERVKLYAFMYLATIAGYKIEDVLERYKGTLKEYLENAKKQAYQEGLSLRVTLWEELRKQMDPVESTLVRSSLLADRSELPKALRELYEEAFDRFVWRLEALSNAVNLISLIVVGMVIIFNYVFVFLPLMRAMRSIVAG